VSSVRHPFACYTEHQCVKR